MQEKYYDLQTEQALANFNFGYQQTSLDLIYAITEIKKAAALAHKKCGEMSSQIADGIVNTCDEILEGKLDRQFITSAIQGGAGTSINMNVNEVIANRASEIKEIVIHPNDDVNRSQSTNDVNPSALRIVCIRLMYSLIISTEELIKSFEAKAKQFYKIKKLARTHLQDAIPTTLGEEMKSYADILRRDKRRIKEILPYLYNLNLGGTAIGNSLNASENYIKEVYIQLEMITKMPLTKNSNLMSLTSSQTDFYHLSSLLVALCLDLSKIATDLRLMSSGPRGGLGEIMLESLQPGSSIMPGKINPVMPESMNQIYYFVSGKHLTIEHAVEGANLELGVMFPVIADSLIQSLKIMDKAISLFTKKCSDTLKAYPINCERHLENSMAYATMLVPKLGYDVVSSVVKKAIIEHKTLREVISESKLLSKKDFNI